MSGHRFSSSANGPGSAGAPASRSTTNELFPALDRSAQVATLQQLFDAFDGRALELRTALTLGAAIAERVAVVHAAGRVVGALDASRIRVSVEGRVTLARQSEGSLAPELLRGEAPTLASDVFAVGYLVHQLLTGSAPVATIAVPPSRFNPVLDAEIDSVVLAALHEEPSARPASVMALQAALEGLGEELGLKTDVAGIGALVQPLITAPAPVAAPVAVPAPSAIDRLAAAWFAAPGLATDHDEGDDDEVTWATPERRPYALIACGAGLLAMLLTVVASSFAGRATQQSEELKLAPAPARVFTPRALERRVLEQPAPSRPAGPSHPAKRKHHGHR